MTTGELTLELRGGLAEFWDARDREILLEGPRGTGKTRVVLELIDALCRNFPGLSVLVVRKFQKTLATTCLRTLNEQVLPARGGGVTFFGGNDTEPASYRYSNGSRIVVGGMDNPEKVKSSEYDFVYENECTELTEEDHESLLPLLRHMVDGKPVIEAQRIVGDCNPANAGNWANQRAERGQMRRIRTKLKDNPAFFDERGYPTPAGQAYLLTLESLTGPRRERWLEGKWSGVENMCYEAFDPEVHIRPLEPNLQLTNIIGVDYGREHLCAVVAVSFDQFNRGWVREAWAEADKDEGKSLNLTIAQFKHRYSAMRGRVDPNHAYLAGQVHFSIASSSATQPRLHRIDLAARRFYIFPGGRVPKFSEEINLTVPQGPFAEPDSPGLFLVEGAPGIDELADEIEGYHFVYTETAKGKSKDVYRVDENRIAAMEYAIEEWEEGTRGVAALMAPPLTLRKRSVHTGI